MKPYFSIITAVYNVEKYISECVESVLSQTFEDFELLLVDDGSTDSSGDICDRYSELDERIRVYHQKNCGAFKARAKGIEEARGVFYVGLDADDLLNKECLQRLHEILLEVDVDCISYQSKDLGSDSRSLPMLEINCIKAGYEFIYEVIKQRNPNPWNKAIRMDCVKRADYSEVPEKQSISLDSLTIIPALCEVKSVYVIKDALYIYRIREDSICHSYNINKALDLAKVYSYDESKFIKYGIYDDKLKEALYVDYLKNILSRVVSPYKRNEITSDDLNRVKQADFYKKSVQYEKCKFFSLNDYRKLKTLRKGLYWLL